MAVDGNNRVVDLGDATIQSLVDALKAPVDQVYQAEVPGVEDKLDALYEWANAVAGRVDPDASQEVAQDLGFADAVFRMNQTLREGLGRTENIGRQTNELLSNAANNIHLLAEHLSQPDSLWLNINQISGQAQRDIANAIHMAGCCVDTVKPIGPVTQEATDASR